MLLRIVGVQIQIEIENGWCTADTVGIQSIRLPYFTSVCIDLSTLVYNDITKVRVKPRTSHEPNSMQMNFPNLHRVQFDV